MDISITAGEYKSIKAPLQWSGIPKFAVLTGENGTGKTQFLQFVHGCLSPPHRDTQNPFAGFRTEVSGINIGPSDVVFLPDMSGRMPSHEFGLSEISSTIRELINRAAKNDAPRGPYERLVLTQLRELGAANTDAYELVAKFRPEFFYYNPLSMHDNVASHFVNYEIEYANLRKRGVTHEDAIASLGNPLWEALDDLLEASGFAYEIITPREMDLRSNYVLRFRHRDLGRVVRSEDLSSGEAALVRLYLWLYAADRRFTFPKLVLLDEPDSHLHPTLIKSFIGSLERGLVETLGCNVIMTTHRTETIAFAPEEALFEMHAIEPAY